MFSLQKAFFKTDLTLEFMGLERKHQIKKKSTVQLALWSLLLLGFWSDSSVTEQSGSRKALMQSHRIACQHNSWFGKTVVQIVQVM